jgi:hypothetical protein
MGPYPCLPPIPPQPREHSKAGCPGKTGRVHLGWVWRLPKSHTDPWLGSEALVVVVVMVGGWGLPRAHDFGQEGDPRFRAVTWKDSTPGL